MGNQCCTGKKEDSDSTLIVESRHETVLQKKFTFKDKEKYSSENEKTNNKVIKGSEYLKQLTFETNAITVGTQSGEEYENLNTSGTGKDEDEPIKTKSAMLVVEEEEPKKEEESFNNGKLNEEDKTHKIVEEEEEEEEIVEVEPDIDGSHHSEHEDEHFNQQKDNKISVVFLVYAPGTNKDDVVFPALDKRSFDKISLKETLNSYGLDHPKYGKIIKECLENKKQVPSDICVEILDEIIESQKSICTRFLICGFPRTEENSEAWKEKIGKKYNIAALIYVSYTRKEYEIELKEKEKLTGIRLDYKEIHNRYNYFLKNTNKVFDDFGLKKLIKVSAKLSDKMIVENICHNKLITKNFPLDE